MNITSNLADYALQFEPQVDSLKTLLIDPAPFRSGKEAQTKLENGKLALSYPMLDDGLIIYETKDLKSVSLVSEQDDHRVTEDISDFPYLAIWSPEKKHCAICLC